MITQTVNIYNKDNEKCDHMFVCLFVKIRFNGKMSYHSNESPSRSHWQRGFKALVYGRLLVGNAGRISLGTCISISC
jgi:hypothetical protein